MDQDKLSPLLRRVLTVFQLQQLMDAVRDDETKD